MSQRNMPCFTQYFDTSIIIFICDKESDPKNNKIAGVNLSLMRYIKIINYQMQDAIEGIISMSK